MDIAFALAAHCDKNDPELLEQWKRHHSLFKVKFATYYLSLLKLVIAQTCHCSNLCCLGTQALPFGQLRVYDVGPAGGRVSCLRLAVELLKLTMASI